MLRTILISALSVLFITQASAYGLLNQAEREAELKKIAKQNVDMAKENYLNKFYECFQEGEKNKIGIPFLTSKGLTIEESKIALLYLSSKNYKSCVGETANQYSIAVNLARYFNVEGYSLKDDPELGNSISLADSLAIDEMKYSVDYSKISESKRKAIESDPSLQKVFGIKSQISKN